MVQVPIDQVRERAAILSGDSEKLARPSLRKAKMARMSLPTPTLQTARLLLRPLTSADADALFALHSSAYVLRYWDAPP